MIVAATHRLSESPEGNVFPARDDLVVTLERAGFEIGGVIDAADLPSGDDGWHDRADRVVATVGRDHDHETAWRQAEHQQSVMSRLPDTLVGSVLAGFGGGAGDDVVAVVVRVT